MPHRPYIAIFIIGLAALYALAIFNWIVNPFYFFPHQPLGIYLSSDRLAKPRLVARGSFDSILLGSSITANIQVAGLPAARFFNASLPSGMPEEFLFFIERYGGNARLVVIGLDFFMMNERGFPFVHNPTSAFEPLEAPTGRHVLNIHANRTEKIGQYLFSYDVTVETIRATINWWFGRPNRLSETGDLTEQTEQISAVVSKAEDFIRGLETLRDYHFAGFEYSTERVESLRHIHALLKRRGVKAIVFINPLHEDTFHLIHDMGLAAFLDRFRADVRGIFPHAADLSQSHWSDRRNFRTGDPLHYTSAVGKALIESLLF